MLQIGRKFNGVQAHYLTLLATYSSSSTISTSSTQETPSSCLADFLVHSLGFSKQQSLSTTTKLSNLLPTCKPKKVSDSTFAANANSVINFFKQLGFDDAHIRKVVSLEPRILTAKVEQTLKPKIKLLKDLGFSGSDLVHAISVNPTFVRSNLDPAVQALRVVLGSDENVITFLKKSTLHVVTYSAKYLISNVALLENEYGIPGDKIRRYILRNSRPFLQKSEEFRDTVWRVEHELGIPRDSGMFLYGIHTLVCLSEKTIESKCRLFKSFGWSETDVAVLMRKNPHCLMTSELRIKTALDFYMKELGHDPAFLASRPTLLMFSYEERVLPRYRVWLVLKEKGLLPKVKYFCNTLFYSEAKFFQKFVQPFTDKLPDLSESDRNKIGTQVPGQGKADSPVNEIKLIAT